MSTDLEMGLLKTLHSSLCVSFGTDAPFELGRVSGEKVGYAQEPSVVLSVFCRDEDLSVLVPIVRQHVYGELAERGWSPDDVEFTPGTMRGRRRKFVDRNESSPSCGKNKFGVEYRFRFAMGRELAGATFRGYGSFAPLPERRASDAWSVDR